MKIFSDCLPCMLRQVSEATYMVTDDEEIHEKVMDEALEILSRHREYASAPEIAKAMHRVVKKQTRVTDPYSDVKDKDITEALKIEPLIISFTNSSKDLLGNVLKASATGNIMDSAIYSSLDIEACLIEELEKPFAVFDKKALEEDLKGAKLVLIIADNAGEVVFDKPLAKFLAEDYRVVYAVRDKPIINDATVDDALKTGIQEYAGVMSSGSSMPGAVLEACNDEFKEIFNQADVVISKGQGNFEALSDPKRRVYFLLKAKCRSVAKVLGVEEGQHVFMKKG